jgi:hypothetical protein
MVLVVEAWCPVRVRGYTLMSKARPADNPYIDKVRASLAISGVRAPYVKRWSGGALRISFKYFQDASKVRDALATLNAHTASGVFFASPDSISEFFDRWGGCEVRAYFPEVPGGAP